MSMLGLHGEAVVSALRIARMALLACALVELAVVFSGLAHLADASIILKVSIYSGTALAISALGFVAVQIAALRSRRR